MPSTFDFHYVYTPTGSISGPSVLTQTEDAINDLGEYMVQTTAKADEALRQAKQAVSTANTAQQNAAEARSTADSALSQVQTLTVTVESWGGRITAAEGNAATAVSTANSALANVAQAVTTANSANATSQQAVTTANSALSLAKQANATATQAVGTANSALTTAQNAEAIARQAVTDSGDIREEINADMETINNQVAAATTQAHNAQSAAAQAQGSSNLAERWATWMDGTVDGSEYSSKYYAAKAKANAERTGGPTGMVAFFALRSVPDGWLICNGAAVSRTTYADLFAVIGTDYGAGDGSTTFRLPNAHRRFLEATTSTSEVGDMINESLPEISGTMEPVSNTANTIQATASGAFQNMASGRWGAAPKDFAASAVFGFAFYASRSDSTYNGNKVQPASFRLLLCIKT